MDGFLSVVRLVSSRYSSYSYCLILTKLGTHDLCASMQKNCGTDFQNFDSKIFAEFLKFSG